MHCCGSVAFWYGSGSDDPYHWFMYPDTAIFVSGWQDANTKISFFLKFFCLYVHQPSRRKVKKKPQNSKIKDLLTFFACWWFLWYPICYVGFYELFVLWVGSTHPGGGVVGEEMKEIHWKRSTLFGLVLLCSIISTYIVYLQKQAVPDVQREERLD
jgi:hypothetical protein